MFPLTHPRPRPTSTHKGQRRPQRTPARPPRPPTGRPGPLDGWDPSLKAPGWGSCRQLDADFVAWPVAIFMPWVFLCLTFQFMICLKSKRGAWPRVEPAGVWGRVACTEPSLPEQAQGRGTSLLPPPGAGRGATPAFPCSPRLGRHRGFPGSHALHAGRWPGTRMSPAPLPPGAPGVGLTTTLAGFSPLREVGE